jgi:hypothetical protein
MAPEAPMDWLIPLTALVFVGCSSPSSPDAAAAKPPSCPSASLRAAPQAAAAPVLFVERFEDGCFKSRGWYDNTAVDFDSTQHVAGSTGSARFRFAKGASTPASGGAMRRLFTPSNSIYISYYVKYSANWVGSGKPYHPHEFMVLSSMDDDYAGPSVSWLALYVEQNYQNGGMPRLQIQDSKAINLHFGDLPLSLLGITQDIAVGGCNGLFEPGMIIECYNAPPWTNDKQLRGPVTFQPNPGPGYKGDWNHVEAYYQLNTIADGDARGDGVMQYWFNGAPIIDRHDIVFRTAPRAALQLKQFLIAPYIGDGSPVEQTMWVDNLTVASARVTAR